MSKATEHPPRWSYVVAAIVAVVGMVWGVVSYFIPKAESPQSTAEPRTTVTVTGTDNVGVGTMSGGSISKGSPTHISPVE